MSVLSSISRQLTPVHREGYIFIAAFFVISLLLSWLWTPLMWAGFVMTAWCAYFFRDPARLTPLRDGLVISPADGLVSMIGAHAPPPELGLGETPLQRVSVFMSVFDCHVNRAPMTGRIVKIAYKPGLFLNADLDKASEDNERSGMIIETPHGRLCIVQIAGLIARRIVSFVREGDTIGAGERFGLIRFGSRVDVYLPESARLLVGVGSKAIAGETMLADLKTNDPKPVFRLN